MRTATVAIVWAGLALALVLGFARGLDPTGVTILVLIAVAGAVAIAAAGRSAKDEVAPARCRACGGVISRHAPFCKHCGARAKDPG